MLLGDPGSGPATVSVEIVRARGPITLAVDAVEGRHEIVIRPLRGPLAFCGAYAAAGVLDDGAPVVVLDPEAL